MPTATKLPRATTVTVPEPLAASTALIPNMTTLCGMTPTAASMALANTANGPINDVIGNNGLALNHFKEAARLVSYLQKASDAADPNLTLLNGVFNCLIGSGSPVSSNVMQSMDTILANGLTPATAVKCNAPAGPIIDYIGNNVGVYTMFKEARNILALIYRTLDVSDPMRTLVADILLTLASTQTLAAFMDWLEENGPVYDVPPVALDPTSQIFTRLGGYGEFSVTITGLGVSRSWTVDKDSAADWLELQTPPLHEPQTEDGMVTYTIAPNTTTVARVAHFYINGKTYTVDQEA